MALGMSKKAKPKCIQCGTDKDEDYVGLTGVGYLCDGCADMLMCMAGAMEPEDYE